jgi:hypothetical protein
MDRACRREDLCERGRGLPRHRDESTERALSELIADMQRPPSSGSRWEMHSNERFSCFDDVGYVNVLKSCKYFR